MAGREALSRLTGRSSSASSPSTGPDGCAPARTSFRRAKPGPDTDQGYVTSVCFSPVLDQWIGLGLVEHGRERIGEIVPFARSAAWRGF